MQSGSTLQSLFALILENYVKIKKFEIVSTDDKFKELLKESCTICQKAIQMVNQIELFSKNETLEDLSTQSIRYLTLPAFLAFFTSQKSDREERVTMLKLAQHWSLFSDNANLKTMPPALRRDPNVVREEKIRAYKVKKALEQRVENFLSFDSPRVDDETLREESLALVRYWAYTAVEELKLIGEEVAILSRFSGSQGPSPPSSPTHITRRPPLLITREKIRAAVFGAGYPSLPTMTLDQFVELQVQQGLIPPPHSEKGNKLGSEEGIWRRFSPSESVEVKQEAETRAAREDALEDAYSEEQRTKARNFDEFKDEHRRGSGNRANLFASKDLPEIVTDRIICSLSPFRTTVVCQQKAQARRSADDDDDLRDREDEAPQVVAGIGVSESEAIEFSQRNLVKRQPQARELVSAGEDKPTTKEIEAEQSGRVIFRKPRVKEDSKVTGVKGAKNERKKETEKPKRTAVVQKDKKQGGSLSFSYEDDEDEDD
ncbi:unnamed protein product [Hydatigera taeniaeformis]|uniref:TAP42-like protein n=1 Tax=Hydatigena taeniaeformis TaxID=6205 RepID=A0A158RFA5_HYDTA|nr:unnamed protein product [Hydatigera taeniaeformis]